MVITSTPHDAVFKDFLCQSDIARDFLQIHLPAALLQHCDLATLKLESGSFVDRKLRAIHSDVLYSMKTVDGKGYIYCLFEHQSSPDRHMTFRLMRYALAAMQRHLDNVDNQLPLVIPVLFYHGQVSPWPFSVNWLQAFANPQLATKIYTGDFPLVDVTAIPDDIILTHRRIAALELVQKHIRQRDLMEFVEQLVMLWMKGCTNDEQFIMLINYLLRAGDTASPQEFIHALAQRTSCHGGEIMSPAEWLKQEGHKEGHKEGHQAAKREMASNMLANGVELALVMKVTGLKPDELRQLQP